MQQVSRADREAVAELCVNVTQTWRPQPGSALSGAASAQLRLWLTAGPGCSTTVIPVELTQSCGQLRHAIVGGDGTMCSSARGHDRPLLASTPPAPPCTTTTKAEGTLSKLCSLNIHAVPVIVYTLGESLWICRIEWVVLNGTEQCLWRWTARCVLSEALEAVFVCCEGPWARSGLYNMRNRTDSLTDRTHSPWLPNMPGNTMLRHSSLLPCAIL